MTKRRQHHVRERGALPLPDDFVNLNFLGFREEHYMTPKNPPQATVALARVDRRVSRRL